MAFSRPSLTWPVITQWVRSCDQYVLAYSIWVRLQEQPLKRENSNSSFTYWSREEVALAPGALGGIHLLEKGQEKSAIRWSYKKTGEVPARRKRTNKLIDTLAFPIPWMKEVTVGGVSWIQIMDYQFNAAGNWELLKVMGRNALRLYQTNNMDPFGERTDLETGNQIRRLTIEESRYQVMKSHLN